MIEKFEADFGGTEIFKPLNEIFKLSNQRNNPNIQTLVYLLTDGAVHNTEAIVNLVKENCGKDSMIRLHTFGIGQGADQKLIKGCAFAGLGNFSFIYKAEEIERKVIE